MASSKTESDDTGEQASIESTGSSSEPPLLPSLTLPGGALIWIIIVIELVTFFAFFVMYAQEHAEQPAAFRDAQTHLSILSGTINTVVLLVGSWLIARASAAAIRGHKHQWGWMAATAGAGVLFTTIKLLEYRHVVGVADSDNMFWFYYLFLTIFHLVHVLVGVALCVGVAWKQRPSSTDAPEVESVEASAMFWHLVDLVWIILFPLLYIVEVSP